MRYRSRRKDDNEDLNIWPAFTDLMSNAFMIVILFLLLAIVKSVFLQKTVDLSKKSVSKLVKEVQELNAQSTELERQIAGLKNQLKSAKTITDTPPIIVIEDEAAYRFASGSAEIPPPMDTYIRSKIVPAIEQYTKKYQINVVELIGHTDGQPNGGIKSNLDLNIEQVASADLPVKNLKSGSNADLGLMRSLAVVKVLRDIQTKEGKLQGLKFRAYSAAQLILPNGDFAPIDRTPDTTRRRIEIRFTRLGEVTKVK